MTTIPKSPILRCQLPASLAWRPEISAELRGLAVVLVILQYAGGMLGWSTDLHLGLGIDLLFILTGIGLTFGTRDPGAPASQPARILPAYWIVLALYCACNLHFLQLHYTGLNLAAHALGIQGWLGDSYALSIDEPLCLVALILTFSLLYRFGRAVLGSIESLLLAGGVFSVAVACAFYFRGQAGSFSSLGQPLPGFFVGLLLGQLLKTGQLELKLGPTLAIAGLLFTYIPFTQGVLFNNTLAGLTLMGAYVFAWKPLGAPLLVKATSRILKLVGTYWLEILIIQQPLIREYNYYLEGRWFGLGAPTPGSLIIGIAIGLAVTLVVSMALHHLLRKIPRFGPSAP